MDHQEKVAAEVAYRAQLKGESPAVASFKGDLVASEGRDGLDQVRDLEIIAQGDAAPRDMSDIDPGWEAFEQKQAEKQLAEREMVEHIDALATENAIASTVSAAAEAVSYEEITRAGVEAALAGPQVYGAWLDEVAPDERREIDGDVRATLATLGDQVREQEFQQTMAESERLNIESAQRALANVQARRQMSDGDVERVAASFLSSTDVPLRSALQMVPEERREEFLSEVSIKVEASERADRMGKFALGFFTPDSDISSGLVIRGQRAGGDLPPSLFDSAYREHQAEEQIRREDEARASRPGAQSAAQIKQELLEGDGRSWEQGLTLNGKPVSYSEIAAMDPDSVQNVEQRARERAAWKLGNITGGRVVR